MSITELDSATVGPARAGHLHAVPDTPAALRDGLVHRGPLVRRLIAAHDAALAVLIAPAGYGKTTLLRQWEQADAHPFEWLAADRPGEIVARLARPRDGAVLIVDDFHAVRSAAALRAMRRAAADPAPDGLLVLAARSEPAVPLGRLRAEAGVVELRAGDLAMTARDADRQLRRAGLALEPDDLAALLRRTEGWPAGLALAALSLAGEPDVGGAISRFGGDDRLVADYLRDEFLAALSPEEVTLLVATSPLDDLSGPLCDAVLGRRGSGRVLRDLARSNLLLASLDHAEERFRCHGLLAGLLRADLRRGDPDRERDVHRRASAWHEEQGEGSRAIEHAIAARDVDRAGELIWAVVAADPGAVRLAEVDRWIGRFREPQIASRPTLALAAAVAAVHRGERDAAERWAAAAERTLPRAPAELEGSLQAGAAILRALIARDGLAGMAANAAHAYECADDGSPWRAWACLLAGVAQHLSGERTLAYDALEEGARRGAVLAPAAQALCLAQLALMALEDDDAEQAATLSLRARERALLPDVGASCALVFAVSAFAAAQTGDVARAREDAGAARHRLAALPDPAPWYGAEARITLARAELRLSDAAGARTLLSEASRLLRRTQGAFVLQAWIGDAWERADSFAVAAVAGPSTLTTAELRVLRFLPSHMSFREVAARLHVSTNTVKTQAHAVYRKLDASSRSEAVTRARQVGLIDG